jgi:N-acetylglutamate synthase-like GNAT family acetyltransferase
MGIEEAKPEDAQEILYVVNEANQEAFRRIIPKDYFKEPILTRGEFDEALKKMTFYVYRLKEKIAAVAALSTEDACSGRIRWVYVLTRYQKQGVGTAVVHHLEKVARQKGLKKITPMTDNGAEWALKFYRKLGFILAYRVPNPWGFDVWMEKNL